MSDRRNARGARPGPAARLLLAAALAAAPAPAAAQTATLEPRVPAGKRTSAAGTLLAREAPGRPWRAAEAVSTRDALLALPGLRAEVEPRPAGVGMTLWGNLPALSPSPTLESEAVLHDSRAFDLDVTLVEGRAVLTNRKAEGEARVWLRFRGEGWELTLAEPGAQVAVEIYGRWLRGVPFSRDLTSADRPVSVLELHVLKGQAQLRAEGRLMSLGAPPGPAYFRWDSLAGAEGGPQRRDKPPAWADAGAEPGADARAAAAAAEKYLGLLKSKAPDEALLALLAEADHEADKARAHQARQFGVFGLMALGELMQVADALADPNHPDVRQTAVLALRHWIGEAPGRDLQLDAMLREQFRYTPGQSEAVLQLLHDPFDPSQAETYDVLLAYLNHGRLAVRELARWHLVRLVPAGRDIPYDAAGREEDRAKAVAAWRKAVADRGKGGKSER
jgi:hypothetical protein